LSRERLRSGPGERGRPLGCIRVLVSGQVCTPSGGLRVGVSAAASTGSHSAAVTARPMSTPSSFRSPRNLDRLPFKDLAAPCSPGRSAGREPASRATIRELASRSRSQAANGGLNFDMLTARQKDIQHPMIRSRHAQAVRCTRQQLLRTSRRAGRLPHRFVCYHNPSVMSRRRTGSQEAVVL
jgi:hypothetical protein